MNLLGQKCDGDNEVLITKSNKCVEQQRSCKQPAEQKNCTFQEDPPFCGCKDGYLHNQCGTCVPEKSCDPTADFSICSASGVSK